MPATVLLGLQWGDEGKGKLVDVLAPQHEWVCRFQGGPNAGHTIVFDDRKFVLHQIPSGIFHAGVKCAIGNGVVLNPLTFQEELAQLDAAGFNARPQLYLSTRAHLILPSHRLLDQAQEEAKGAGKIGSTLRGIGPTYQDKYARVGLRVGDILRKDFTDRVDALIARHARRLKSLGSELDATADRAAFLTACALLREVQLVDTEILLNEALNAGTNVLVEGAQGTLLDVDFGAYPYVTSSHTIAGGAATGLGIAPQHVQRVIGVFKAYATRVGNGPFPTELHGAIGERLRESGGEFGATTGRPRRCGWLDLPALRYACLLNGVTELALTKADVLCGFGEIQVCTHYDCNGTTHRYLPADGPAAELATPVYRGFSAWGTTPPADQPEPAELAAYLDFLEAELGAPIRHVSLGPGRAQLRARGGVEA